MSTFFDEYQEQLYQRRWTWDDIPFYEGKGAKQSIAPQQFIGIHTHCPQLKSVKLTPWAHYTSAKKGRASIVKLDSQRQNQYHWHKYNKKK